MTPSVHRDHLSDGSARTLSGKPFGGFDGWTLCNSCGATDQIPSRALFLDRKQIPPPGGQCQDQYSACSACHVVLRLVVGYGILGRMRAAYPPNRGQPGACTAP